MSVVPLHTHFSDNEVLMKYKYFAFENVVCKISAILFQPECVQGEMREGSGRGTWVLSLISMSSYRLDLISDIHVFLSACMHTEMSAEDGLHIVGDCLTVSLHCFTVSLHSTDGRQIDCRHCCARGCGLRETVVHMSLLRMHWTCRHLPVYIQTSLSRNWWHQSIESLVSFLHWQAENNQLRTV